MKYETAFYYANLIYSALSVHDSVRVELDRVNGIWVIVVYNDAGEVLHTIETGEYAKKFLSN